MPDRTFDPYAPSSEERDMSEDLYGVRTIWELVERRAERSGERAMLMDGERTVTFGELHAWAERVAAGLADLGIGAGTPVSWQLPNRIETLVASLALARLGAVQNPIIPIYRSREVGFVLRQSGAQVVLHPGTWRGFDHTAMFESIVADLPSPPTLVAAYDVLPEADPARLPPPPEPSEDPVRWLYYTSGTTSDPKGARHTDRTLLAGAIGVADRLRPTSSDVFHLAMPYAHIAGPDLLLTALLHGYALTLSEHFVPEEAIALCRRTGVTMAGGSTAFYTAFLNEQRRHPEGPVVPTLRLLMGGGAPKPPEIFYEVKRILGVPVLHGSGMTECPMISFGALNDTDEQLADTDGAPVRDLQISIASPEGTELGPDAVGEILVRGPMLCRGYADPALDAAALTPDGWFHTGDLGLVRADGHLVITGRIKDIIIRKGENISAKEVEDLLYQHPKVGDIAVVGLPDPERGERVCAVVETAPGAEPLTLAELQAHCRAAGLMVQKIPEQLEITDALPRNATLKVLKYQLRQQLTDADAPRRDGPDGSSPRPPRQDS